jgi:RNA polymerase sigma-70 factor (sigma-E family)
VATGNQAAFGDYVRSRGGMLLRAALSLTGGNQADAEDLVQVTLMKAYQAWERISDLAAVDTYVRRAMVNTHISGWRKRRIDEYPTNDIPDQATADPADERDLHDVVQRALDRLPRQMRAAVMLRYYDDMTEPQVAAAMGITVGTVKSTVARAGGKLRDDEQLREDFEIYRDSIPRQPVARRAARHDQL